MELTHEDIVTKILSDGEIIKVDYTNDELTSQMYTTNPTYDLGNFLKTAPKEVNRWDDKYLFVK